MKLLVLLCLVVQACASPAHLQSPQEEHTLPCNDNNGIDSYRYDFEQSDRSKRKEFLWTGPDGVDYLIIHIHIADENVFQPQIEQWPGSGGGGGGGGGGVPPAVLASLLG